MSILLGIGAFFLGIGIGSVLTKFVIHWITLVATGLGYDVGGARPERQPASKSLLAFAIVHPVPWALFLGVPYGIYLLTENPPSSGWISFLGGIFFALVAIPLATFILIRQGGNQHDPSTVEPGEHSDDNEA